MINIQEQTLSNIVTRFHQTASVFEKHDLDYCCKGKQKLTEACINKSIPVETILDELKPYINESLDTDEHIEKKTVTEIIGYILLHHHFYIRQSAPVLISHLSKLVSKHGERFAYLKKVQEIFDSLVEEMEQHMQKEESILFPRIKEMALAMKSAGINIIKPGYMRGAISVMEDEHESAGEKMAKIRELTNHFTAPQGACVTFNICLSELKAFEEDLHQHVHLENNILFPMVRKMLLENRV